MLEAFIKCLVTAAVFAYLRVRHYKAVGSSRVGPQLDDGGSFIVTFICWGRRRGTRSLQYCRPFLLFREDSSSLLTRKAQACLAGFWCVRGHKSGGPPCSDLHIIPLFPRSSLAVPSAMCDVPKSRTSLLQSVLLVLRESHMVSTGLERGRGWV